MNKTIHTSILIFIALCVMLGNVNAQDVLTRISAPALQQIFKDEGYSFETDGDGDIIWKIEGVRTYVIRSKEGNQITFRLAFNNENTTLAKVNAWNKSKRFSRSYLDDDGDPVLQLDLELDGGITKERIVDYLKTCRVSMAAWAKEVLQ